MKTLRLITLLISLIVFSAHAQYSWKYNPKTETNDYFISAVEDSNENIFTIYTTPTYSSSQPAKPKIVKLNKLGIVSTTTDVLMQDSALFLANLFVLNDNSILAVGVCGIDNQNLNTIWVSKFDNNLNLIWTKKHLNSYFNTELYNFEVLKRINGNFLAYNTYIINTNTYNQYHTCFFEIDVNGNLINTVNNFNQNINRWFYDLVEKPDGNAFKAFGRSRQTNTNSSNLVMRYDSNLNFIDSVDIPKEYYQFYSAKYISNNKYIFVGQTTNQAQNQFTNDIGMTLTDANSDTLLQSKRYGKVKSIFGDTIEFASRNNAIDFVDSNKIYVTGTSGFNLNVNFTDSSKRWFCVAQLDRNFAIKWKKYFGGDGNYFSMSSLATKDGGVLLMGLSHYPNETEQTDAFMIKLDANGIYNSLHDTNFKIYNYLLYPNPGNNQLSIQGFSNNTSISIFTSNGSLVYETEIENSNTQINTRNFKSGIYFYQFKNNNGEILQSGKWIRE
jgi:hypothetical protein